MEQEVPLAELVALEDLETSLVVLLAVRVAATQQVELRVEQQAEPEVLVTFLVD